MTGAELHDLRLKVGITLSELAREAGTDRRRVWDAERRKLLRPGNASRFERALLRIALRTRRSEVEDILEAIA